MKSTNCTADPTSVLSFPPSLFALKTKGPYTCAPMVSGSMRIFA